MANRHWLLLALWTCLLLVVTIAIVTNAASKTIGLPLLITPLVAIATFVRLFRRTGREALLSPRWATVHRILGGLSVALAIGGIVGAASQLVDVGGSRRLENGPLALLFLLSLIGSYHALVRPTPRNTALPALIVHIAWMPLVLWNLQYEVVDPAAWQQGLIAIGVLGLLATSGLLALVALAAFTGAVPRVPEARVTVAHEGGMG